MLWIDVAILYIESTTSHTIQLCTYGMIGADIHQHSESLYHLCP